MVSLMAIFDRLMETFVNKEAASKRQILSPCVTFVNLYVISLTKMTKKI